LADNMSRFMLAQYHLVNRCLKQHPRILNCRSSVQSVQSSDHRPGLAKLVQPRTQSPQQQQRQQQQQLASNAA
jgi:hypothetical protein